MENALFHKPALQPLEDTRPSLFDLWKQHQFQSGLLTFKAKVPPGTVHAMLCNKPVARDHARKILAALSELAQTQYTLQLVAVVTIEDSNMKQCTPSQHTTVQEMSKSKVYHE